MVLFYMINAAVHFSFMAQMATPATIAITHSVFNITATLVWLPFSNLLVKLACLTIRDDKVDEVSREDQEFMILESRFLENRLSQWSREEMRQNIWSRIPERYWILHLD